MLKRISFIRDRELYSRAAKRETFFLSWEQLEKLHIKNTHLGIWGSEQGDVYFYVAESADIDVDDEKVRFRPLWTESGYGTPQIAIFKSSFLGEHLVDNREDVNRITGLPISIINKVNSRVILLSEHPENLRLKVNRLLPNIDEMTKEDICEVEAFVNSVVRHHYAKLWVTTVLSAADDEGKADKHQIIKTYHLEDLHLFPLVRKEKGAALT